LIISYLMNPRCKEKDCDGFVESHKNESNFGKCNRCAKEDMELATTNEW